MTDRHNVRTYFGLDRADVEVLTEGRGWVAGEVRMQWQDNAGAWWAEVQYRSPEHNSTMIDSFPAERVRPDETVCGRQS